MAPLTFEDTIQVRQVSTDIFENIHPTWTWPWSGVVPGGILMSMAAASAYKTLPDGYALDNLQAQFLAGSQSDVTFTCRVSRLTEGKRFTIRSVLIQQKNKNVASITLGFVNASPWNGPSMKHTVTRATTQQIEHITVDDLEPGRGELGSFMKFQRLPLVHQIPQQPQTSVKPVAAHIIGPMKAPAGTTPHILGLLNLSDYHVLGGPPDLHGISVGQPAMDDTTYKRTPTSMKLNTSLNHTVHIHSYDFRADEMVYIEVTSPWTGGSLGLVHSRIFSQRGVLLASCAQEAFYILKPDAKSSFGSKL